MLKKGVPNREQILKYLFYLPNSTNLFPNPRVQTGSAWTCLTRNWFIVVFSNFGHHLSTYTSHTHYPPRSKQATKPVVAVWHFLTSWPFFGHFSLTNIPFPPFLDSQNPFSCSIHQNSSWFERSINESFGQVLW